MVSVERASQTCSKSFDRRRRCNQSQRRQHSRVTPSQFARCSAIQKWRFKKTHEESFRITLTHRRARARANTHTHTHENNIDIQKQTKATICGPYRSEWKRKETRSSFSVHFSSLVCIKSTFKSLENTVVSAAMLCMAVCL